MLSREEVAALFGQLKGTEKRKASLMYGAGLRVSEVSTLRVQDIDLNLKTITVRNTKGMQARVVMIPDRLVQALEKHLIWRRQLHLNDLYSGGGYVDLPDALSRKYKNAPTSFEWQYLFPSNTQRLSKQKNVYYRWYSSVRTLQKAVSRAAKQININKLSYIEAFVRYAFTGIGNGHQNHPGVDGTQRPQHDDDIYACVKARRAAS